MLAPSIDVDGPAPALLDNCTFQVGAPQNAMPCPAWAHRQCHGLNKQPSPSPALWPIVNIMAHCQRHGRSSTLWLTANTAADQHHCGRSVLQYGAESRGLLIAAHKAGVVCSITEQSAQLSCVAGLPISSGGIQRRIRAHDNTSDPGGSELNQTRQSPDGIVCTPQHKKFVPLRVAVYTAYSSAG